MPSRSENDVMATSLSSHVTLKPLIKGRGWGKHSVRDPEPANEDLKTFAFRATMAAAETSTTTNPESGLEETYL